MGGEGGLEQSLKKFGVIAVEDCAEYTYTDNYALLYFSWSLDKQGVENVDRIIENFFTYIELVK